MPAPTVVAPMPTYDWRGFHIGVDGGYGWGEIDHDKYEDSIDLTAKGAFGGIFAGYDYQFDDWVLGIEGDIQFSKVNKEVTFSIPDTGQLTLEYGPKRFGSARLRAGPAAGLLLPYVTGGLAFGKLEVSGTAVDLDGERYHEEINDTTIGYTIGAGVDYALRKRLIGRIEYQYMDFGEFRFSGIDSGTATEVPFHMHTVRAGLGLKF
ncbi:outer membrane protein [Chelativorans xinjiangense]|uniref:outer membrane protein n=1 Tax=Chelativorans xinjiangense TaxID=2681485 RepID=UPI001357CB52|nr:outer membrane protein [Chelativorans xinjiangense]